MIDKIRSAFFKNALGKLLADQKRRRSVHTLESAKNIGILFDATGEQTRKEALEFVKKLEKSGKKVQTLGFFNQKQAPENPAFDAFHLKECTWTGLPKSEKATAFGKLPLDLLLSFNPDNLYPLAWLAASSPASMKIGYATRMQNDFDMQLETPESKGMRYFIEQLEIYLDKIVLTKP